MERRSLWKASTNSVVSFALQNDKASHVGKAPCLLALCGICWDFSCAEWQPNASSTLAAVGCCCCCLGKTCYDTSAPLSDKFFLSSHVTLLWLNVRLFPPALLLAQGKRGCSLLSASWREGVWALPQMLFEPFISLFCPVLPRPARSACSKSASQTDPFLCLAGSVPMCPRVRSALLDYNCMLLTWI